MFARATADAILLTSGTSREWLSLPLSATLPRGFEVGSDFPAALAFTADGRGLLGRSRRGLRMHWDVTPDPRPAADLMREAALLAPVPDAAPVPVDDALRRALRRGDPGLRARRVQAAVPEVPPRRADLPANLVDLGGALLVLNQRDSDSGYEDVPELAPGVHRFLGTDFDVRGQVALYFDGTAVLDASIPHAAKESGRPHRAENIRPGIERFAALSVLASGGGALHRDDPHPYAFVEVDYRDGTRARLPLVYGRDIGWGMDEREGRKGESGLRVAWRETGVGQPRAQRGIARIYLARLVNPSPEKVVAGLALEATDEAWSMPGFFAITLEPPRP
jgi:hypothetical protein